jgi:hypothetical protein
MKKGDLLRSQSLPTYSTELIHTHIQQFKDEAQTAVFKGPVRSAL